MGDTLVEEANRILGLNTAGSAQSLASARAKFASTTTFARAGDQDAAKLLPELGRTVLELVSNTATSRAELERARAQVAASLQGTAAVLGGMFGFSSASSTPTVDVQALLAQIAATAPITSAAAQGQTATAAAAQGNLAAMVDELKGLRGEVAELKDSAKRSAVAEEQTRDLIIRVTRNGEAMQTQEAS
ncbi:MAG: hypothetical protein EOP39_27535 [Rubrivivax sp.]|nr:MAG: hypothetical protein EOP39_27535 [Rubrivivax sp.]